MVSGVSEDRRKEYVYEQNGIHHKMVRELVGDEGDNEEIHDVSTSVLRYQIIKVLKN